MSATSSSNKFRMGIHVVWKWIPILILCLLSSCPFALARNNSTNSTFSQGQNPEFFDIPQTLAPSTETTTAFDGNETAAPTSPTSFTNDDDTETPFPTPSPTKKKTSPPQTVPTLAPTKAAITLVPVIGQVPLKLVATPSLLIGSSELVFLSTVKQFFQFKLLDVVEDVDAQILRQSRTPLIRRLLHQLQRNLMGLPLYLDLRVTGRRIVDLNEVQDVLPFDLNTLLLSIVESDGEELATSLRMSDDPYFSQVSEATIATPTDNFNTPAPTRPPSLQSISGSAQDGPALDTEIIVAIAVGAFLFVVLVIIFCRLSTKKASGGMFDERTFSSGGALAGEDKPPRKSWLRASTARSARKQSKHQPLRVQSSDLESQGVCSYSNSFTKGGGDADSYFGGSVIQNNSMIQGVDNISYAYSLEPGLESSIVNGSIIRGEMNNTPTNSVPTEIPQITVENINQNHRFNPPESSPSVISEYAPGDDGVEGQELSLAPSDLRLTESELAMLPANLRDGDFGEEDDLITREVIAPPGKLGLVIDTTVEGPLVHEVTESSALKGKIWPGDIIIAIDDVDTRAMSAAKITALMIKTANQQRRLTIVGKSESDDFKE